MFRVDDIRERVDKRPFEPFRLRISDGRTYEVPHPDLCMFGRSSVYVGLPDPEVQRAVMRVDQVAVVHIVSIEGMENGKRANGKGRPKKRG